MSKNTWKTESEELLLKTPVMNLVRRNCTSSENGNTWDFYILKSREWCNIIPVTRQGELVLVRQYRVGIESHTLEIPGGVMDKADTDPRTAALREMIEETGYEPASSAKTLDLGSCHPNPAILNNRTHFYAIGAVEKKRAQNLDPGEMIEIVTAPIEKIPSMIASGEISHALTLSALFFLSNHFSLKNPGSANPLVAALGSLAE